MIRRRGKFFLTRVTPITSRPSNTNLVVTEMRFVRLALRYGRCDSFKALFAADAEVDLVSLGQPKEIP